MPAGSPDRNQARSPERMPAQSPEMKQARSPERMPAQSPERKQALNLERKPVNSSKSKCKACCDRKRIVNRTEKEQKKMGVFISDSLENALVNSPKTDVLYTV